jgi:hypothetical protein
MSVKAFWMLTQGSRTESREQTYPSKQEVNGLNRDSITDLISGNGVFENPGHMGCSNS